MSRVFLPTVLLGLLLAGCGDEVPPPAEEQEAEVDEVEVDPRDLDDDEGELVAEDDARREVHDPGERPGEEIYERHCKACHATGAARAPRVGDTAWWENALEDRGMEGLLRTTIQGARAMPRRGMCMSCTDDELEATIRWMLEESDIEP